ncbi:MAG: MerR family transcriptional regulator [Paludibacter sp.]|nr:MerR family transcriptional regulator [Bacteroidales bacterium]MCM1069221.1 MerR family transcriptional regulator [Prevotella sp.]MCM1354359.1 MerR family transcriptional regulator [Bacteroides sp.]MCM1443181.1 MerR family transcriptional regulator [Muribaculum sp.]MCM1481776.1 MerR family transcriptional regulator [Paludibacter sp.]
MERVYYSIKEVSEITNLPFTTLRFWEKTFQQLSPHRNFGKTRFYTTDDIALIKQIKFLRDEKHLSIPAIQQQLQNNQDNVNSKQRLYELLQDIKQELINIRSHI